jgi:hypothetical protein
MSSQGGKGFGSVGSPAKTRRSDVDSHVRQHMGVEQAPMSVAVEPVSVPPPSAAAAAPRRRSFWDPTPEEENVRRLVRLWDRGSWARYGRRHCPAKLYPGTQAQGAGYQQVRVDRTPGVVFVHCSYTYLLTVCRERPGSVPVACCSAAGVCARCVRRVCAVCAVCT